MAKLNEKEIAVARVYSRSMLGLAGQRGEEESLMEELFELRDYLDSHPAIDAFFTSPLVDREERREKLEQLLRGNASELLVDSLQVLNAHGRIDVLRTIIETYRLEYQERHGHIDVHVSSAVPLNEELRAEVRKVAEKLAHREPDLIVKIDPSLIGGMIIRIGDRKIDFSVAKDLRELRGRLETRATREVLQHRASAGA